MEVEQRISQHVQLFCGSSLLRFEHMCIFVKGCLTFELENILYSVTSSINAGVNQTFSMTLLVTMTHLVVTEELLFNIFLPEHYALYKIMQRDIFSFLILH